MPATPKARKPAYIAASAARGKARLGGHDLGLQKAAHSGDHRIQRRKSHRPGACPSSRHAAAQGSSTVPVPNTGRASTSAVTAASSRAYRWPISRKPASSSQNVTPQQNGLGPEPFPQGGQEIRLDTLALSSRVPSWRRKKAMIRG